MTTHIAVDLDDAEHEALGRWLASTAAAVNPRDPHLDAGEAIRAMIRVTMHDADITSTVASQLRLERAMAKDRKAPPVITDPNEIDRPCSAVRRPAPGWPDAAGASWPGQRRRTACAAGIIQNGG